MRAILALLLLTLGVQTLAAQNCPDGSGEKVAAPSSLQGTLTYHHGLRDWLGLKLQQLACSQREIQLTFSGKAGYQHAETLRGCNVTVTGSLDESPTGYYSTDLFIFDARIEPAASCHPQAAIVYPGDAKIPPTIKSYSVTAIIPKAENSPIRIMARSISGASLTPGEAYIQTRLTGGLVLYAQCAEGFDTTSFSTVEEGKHKPLQHISKDEQSDLNAFVLIDGSIPGNSITLSCRRP